MGGPSSDLGQDHICDQRSADDLPMSSPQEQSKDLAKHKNKLAQAKYRERQRKKKNDVEQQIAALGKKLARLQAVNQTLESRNSTLEELAAESKQEQVMQDLLEQVRLTCTLQMTDVTL